MDGSGRRRYKRNPRGTEKALDKAYNDCISLDLNYDGTGVDENGKPEPEYFTKEEKFQINEAYEDAAKVLRNSSTAAKSYQAQQATSSSCSLRGPGT